MWGDVMHIIWIQEMEDWNGNWQMGRLLAFSGQKLSILFQPPVLIRLYGVDKLWRNFVSGGNGKVYLP